MKLFSFLLFSVIIHLPTKIYENKKHLNCDNYYRHSNNNFATVAGQGVSRRYRPMNIRELLSLQASQPDLQRKYFVAALGSTWVDAEGKKKYPFLGYVDTDRIKGRCLIACRLKNILLNSFDNDLGSGWLFGIVCEEATS